MCETADTYLRAQWPRDPVTHQCRCGCLMPSAPFSFAWRLEGRGLPLFSLSASSASAHPGQFRLLSETIHWELWLIWEARWETFHKYLLFLFVSPQDIIAKALHFALCLSVRDL